MSKRKRPKFRTLNTYDVVMGVQAKVMIRVRAHDQALAKARAADKMPVLMDHIESHYARLKFAQKYTRLETTLVKDGLEAAREYQRQLRERARQERGEAEAPADGQ